MSVLLKGQGHLNIKLQGQAASKGQTTKRSRVQCEGQKLRSSTLIKPELKVIVQISLW